MSSTKGGNIDVMIDIVCPIHKFVSNAFFCIIGNSYMNRQECLFYRFILYADT